MNRSEKLSLAFAAIAGMWIAGSARAAAATAPNVTYTASGTFDTTVVSGNDLFQLAGQPFSMSVVANAATVPTTHGAHWATYSGLKMTGTVQSRLLPTPIAISNSTTSLALATGNPNYDIFQLGSPVVVLGLKLTIKAFVTMPKGTIPSALIHPFTAPVTMTPANATLTYSDGTNSTLLAMNGTLNATIPGGATAVSSLLQLHSGGGQVIASNGDGSQSVRPAGAGPLDVGSEQIVALRLYASGVRDAADVHVRIAGREAPILYVGAADHFAGLDQVIVQVPRSLAGAGRVDVELTADGATAGPVHILIQ